MPPIPYYSLNYQRCSAGSVGLDPPLWCWPRRLLVLCSILASLLALCKRGSCLGEKMPLLPCS